MMERVSVSNAPSEFRYRERWILMMEHRMAVRAYGHEVIERIGVTLPSGPRQQLLVMHVNVAPSHVSITFAEVYVAYKATAALRLNAGSPGRGAAF